MWDFTVGSFIANFRESASTALKNIILILFFIKECQRVIAVFSKIHRSNINKFSGLTSMNFLESVIAMNFSNTQHLVLKRKVPTIAMNNPPVLTAGIPYQSSIS